MNLNIPLKEIIELLGNVARCDADLAMTVGNIASLITAGPEDIAFIFDRGDASVFDAVSLDEIKNSNAGLIIATRPIVLEKKYILVEDTLTAFERIVRYASIKNDSVASETRIEEDVDIHPSVVIDRGAVIGKGSRLSAHVFVGKRCRIGNGVLLHPGVKLLDDCSIGDGSIVQAGAVIGSDGFGYQVSKQGLRKIPQIGAVHIGFAVEIGANCTIDRAAFGATVIGDGVKLDNGVHIAHGVIVGPASAILAQTCIGGGARIGIGCQIGGQVAIKDHITIGNGVKIVSKSAVLNDLKDGEIVAGIPAIPFNQWKRLVVSLNKVPDIIKTFKAQQSFAGATKSWWQRLFQ